MFDARFQLLAQDAATRPDSEDDALEPPDDLAFLEAPSDLVPGVYEGGLKTWECSLDLVTCLADIYNKNSEVAGRRIIEVIKFIIPSHKDNLILDCSLAWMRNSSTNFVSDPASVLCYPANKQENSYSRPGLQ